METSIKSYAAKEHHQPVKRYCRTLDLRDDPKLIAEYRRRTAKRKSGRKLSPVSGKSVSLKWKFTFWIHVCL